MTHCWNSNIMTFEILLLACTGRLPAFHRAVHTPHHCPVCHRIALVKQWLCELLSFGGWGRTLAENGLGSLILRRSASLLYPAVTLISLKVELLN